MMVSFLKNLSEARNVAAHHGRLWNRVFAAKIKLPRKKPELIAGSVNRNEPARLYNTLVMVIFAAKQIAPNAAIAQKLMTQLARHPTGNLAAMEFPADWQEKPTWNV
ncbi:hypothetical protein [Ensifer adhaerens]|uniref:hypothetical protein n=1 Tax=Ensifer adhaerens TaxID=106592 RepID=UPI00080759E7|nr:hypothetical protein [Ensifer adhaerens]